MDRYPVNGEENTPSFLYRWSQLYSIDHDKRASIENNLLKAGYDCVADIIGMPASKARTQMFPGLKGGAYNGLKLMLSGNDVRASTHSGMRFPTLSPVRTP